MRKAWLVLAASLGGCAAGPPLVDMTGVDPVAYQRDLDQCQLVAQDTDPAGPLVVGALMGATIGMGLAAGIAPVSTTAVGYGGAAGAAAGAGVSGATGAPLAARPPAQRQSLAACLTAHGYKVISATQ